MNKCWLDNVGHLAARLEDSEKNGGLILARNLGKHLNGTILGQVIKFWKIVISHVQETSKTLMVGFRLLKRTFMVSFCSKRLVTFGHIVAYWGL